MSKVSEAKMAISIMRAVTHRESVAGVSFKEIMNDAVAGGAGMLRSGH